MGEAKRKAAEEERAEREAEAQRKAEDEALLRAEEECERRLVEGGADVACAEALVSMLAASVGAYREVVEGLHSILGAIQLSLRMHGCVSSAWPTRASRRHWGAVLEFGNFCGE